MRPVVMQAFQTCESAYNALHSDLVDRSITFRIWTRALGKPTFLRGDCYAIFAVHFSKEDFMRSTFTTLAMVGLLMVSAADVYAMAWGGGRGRHDSSNNSSSGSYSGDVTASVPEPSTLYAVGSGLALLAGAGWYIRRRK